MMKASCTLVASMLAASTAAISSASTPADRSRSLSSRPDGGCSSYMNGKMLAVGSSSSSSEEDKSFAPRFDGLRFIETLVTAHR